MGKVHNLQPFPWGLWGLSHPQRHFIRFFDYSEQNSYLKILIRRLWVKMSVGWDLAALQFFGHLKKALKLRISVLMSPLIIF